VYRDVPILPKILYCFCIPNRSIKHVILPTYNQLQKIIKSSFYMTNSLQKITLHWVHSASEIKFPYFVQSFPNYNSLTVSDVTHTHTGTFSALTKLVGWQEGHPACKNWVVRYWHGYLSEARCKQFVYGPAYATGTPSSLASLKFRMVYLSGAGLPRLSWKKGP